MRSNESGFDGEAYNPAEDEARWEAYLALMRRTGEIQVLPGLEDAAPDDSWRPKPPVAIDADRGETKVSAEVEPSTEHPSYAPPFEVAASDVESVAGDLGLAARQPRIGPRGRTSLIAGTAALIALLVLAAANVLGPRRDLRSPASPAPASRAATTGVAQTPDTPLGPEARPGEGAARTTASDAPIVNPQRGFATPPKNMRQAEARPVAQSRAARRHRTSRHLAKRTHAPTAGHADRPKTWTSPYPWSDKRWDSGLSDGAASKPLL